MLIETRHISDYIDFLTSSGFTITLHGEMINDSDLMRYNFHQNPYCHFVKTVYGKWSECVCRQKKVIEKSKDGSFFGCCYAGVGEFIYPITREGSPAGFISVSGFLSDESLSRSEHFAKKNGIDACSVTSLAKKYLNRSIPKKELVDSAITPLVFMLEEYSKNIREYPSGENDLFYKVLHYVSENCHTKITMAHLAKKYNYSISTLSHMFSKKFGESLPSYIDSLRLGEAKWYLLHSKASITEIAQFLGYSSSHYFSTCFLKKTGYTPRDFRKLSSVKI